MPNRGWGAAKPPPGLPLDAANPLARDLLHYWPLNEGAGQLANDLGSLGNPLLLQAASSWRGGAAGAVFHTDASGATGTGGAGTQRPESYTLSTGPGVTFFWTARIPTGQSYGGIIYERNSQVYGPQVDPSGARLTTNWNDDGWWYGSGPVIPDNVWHGGASVVTPGGIYNYINSASDLWGTSPTAATIDASWYVGRDPYGSGQRAINADFGVAAIWKRGLSAQEIAQLMAAPYDLIWKPRYWYIGTQGGAPPAAPLPAPVVLQRTYRPAWG